MLRKRLIVLIYLFASLYPASKVPACGFYPGPGKHFSHAKINFYNAKPINAADGITFVPDNRHNTDSSSSAVIRLLRTDTWRNEKIHCEVKTREKKLNGKLIILVKSEGNELVGKVQPINSVIAEYSAGKCGAIAGQIYKPLTIPDLIGSRGGSGELKSSVNTFWITLFISKNITPGTHRVIIQVAGKPTSTQSLEWIIHVNHHILPVPEKSPFYLNLWQHPYAVAAFNKVEPWSKAHFAVLRPVIGLLAGMGQKCITSSFFWDTNNYQSQDVRKAMIQTVKKKTGTWTYDYSNFDSWVNFMNKSGINEEIAVFGLDSSYPNIWYWDETDKKEVNIGVSPDSIVSKIFWTSLLKDFKLHLIKKGWFGKTLLAFDELPEARLKKDFMFVNSVAPGFRYQVAGLYFKDLQNQISDYALISNQIIPDSIIAQRNARGFSTSYYTSCWERGPNSFISNEPGDSWILAVHSLALKLNGFTRYGYDIWSMKNMTDARNNDVPPGDAFLVYPGGKSSLRLEKLQEGITFSTKIKILGAERGLTPVRRKILEQLLKDFKPFNVINDSLYLKANRNLAIASY